ncbi:MAG: hypothetical protein QM785_11925 [Pyrinomonadaceae bacterium]
MNKKCINCRLVNYADAEKCVRCEAYFAGNATTVSGTAGRKRPIIIRVVVCIGVCLVLLIGFYLSLIGSSKSLTAEQKATIHAATELVRTRGFETEATMLESFAVYRASDSWFNSMIPKENAFAATNFPFEIMTVYADFFAYPADDTERAAILLHEARHLQGKDEKDAYEFVWKNRAKLGWTRDKYAHSPVWQNVRRQTREYAPSLFICEGSDFNDCTE